MARNAAAGSEMRAKAATSVRARRLFSATRLYASTRRCGAEMSFIVPLVSVRGATEVNAHIRARLFFRLEELLGPEAEHVGDEHRRHRLDAVVVVQDVGVVELPREGDLLLHFPKLRLQLPEP